MPKFRITIAIAVFVVSVSVQLTFGQQTQIPAQQVAHPTSPTVNEPEPQRIGFRLAEWKTIHADSPANASADLETLQKLGCEVSSQNHADHIDIQYRCSEWKTMELPNAELIGQWSNWLTAKGIEIVVLNPAANTVQPTVQYRLPQSRTMHLHDPIESEQILRTMKMIGVEVSTRQHGGHLDATFACPEWKTIELPTEDQAHAWQAWLKNAGFETAHTHTH